MWTSCRVQTNKKNEEQKSDKPKLQGQESQKDLSKPLSREEKITSNARQPW